MQKSEMTTKNKRNNSVPNLDKKLVRGSKNFIKERRNTLFKFCNAHLFNFLIFPTPRKIGFIKFPLVSSSRARTLIDPLYFGDLSIVPYDFYMLPEVQFFSGESIHVTVIKSHNSRSHILYFLPNYYNQSPKY